MLHFNVEPAGLAEERAGVMQRDSIDEFIPVAATLHFQSSLGNRQRIAAAPVAYTNTYPSNMFVDGSEEETTDPRNKL